MQKLNEQSCVSDILLKKKPSLGRLPLANDHIADEGLNFNPSLHFHYLHFFPAQAVSIGRSKLNTVHCLGWSRGPALMPHVFGKVLEFFLEVMIPKGISVFENVCCYTLLQSTWLKQYWEDCIQV